MLVFYYQNAARFQDNGLRGTEHIESTLNLKKSLADYRSATVLNDVLFVAAVDGDDLVIKFYLNEHSEAKQNELIDIFYPILV